MVADVLQIPAATPLATTLAKLRAADQRRVYVCTTEGTPERVVSVPDLLSLIAAQA